MLGSLFNKTAGLFFKERLRWLLLSSSDWNHDFFLPFFELCNSWWVRRNVHVWFFCLEKPSEKSLGLFFLFLLTLFSIHFRKFQFFDDTSRSSYGQILPGNGKGNQAWEVHHEDWKYSCDQGATTIEVSMGNFHT